jgi:nanoRNase/pAp phosphatase (c-di-AMP/oligoRNAs hydrolase)
MPLSILATEQQRIEQEAASLRSTDTLYIIDFTGGPSFIAACCARAARVVVLDHHKTGAEDLSSATIANLPNLEKHFDMQRSGATMARDFFKIAQILQDAPDCDSVLSLFNLIEENDLWKHSGPDSKHFSAGMASLQLDFDARNDNGSIFQKLRLLTVAEMVEKGKQISAANELIYAAELATAFEIQIPQHSFRTLAIVTQHSGLRSELGNRLASLSLSKGFAAAGAVVYTEKNLPESVCKVSLRSIGDVDTTPISISFGGGGHKNASSFNVDMSVFESWKL